MTSNTVHVQKRDIQAALVAPQQLFALAQMLPNIFWSRTDYISGAYATKMGAISSPDWVVFNPAFF